MAPESEDGGISGVTYLAQLVEFVFAMREKLRSINEVFFVTLPTIWRKNKCHKNIIFFFQRTPTTTSPSASA